MGLVKGGGTFHGKVQIEFWLSEKSPDYQKDADNSKCLFIDYKGKNVKSITVNETSLNEDTQ